jgi:hypothetical protein
MTNSSAKSIAKNQTSMKPNDTKNARKQNRSAARQHSLEESDMRKRYALAKRLQGEKGWSSLTQSQSDGQAGSHELAHSERRGTNRL